MRYEVTEDRQIERQIDRQRKREKERKERDPKKKEKKKDQETGMNAIKKKEKGIFFQVRNKKIKIFFFVAIFVHSGACAIKHFTAVINSAL